MPNFEAQASRHFFQLFDESLEESIINSPCWRQFFWMPIAGVLLQQQEALYPLLRAFCTIWLTTVGNKMLAKYTFGLIQQVFSYTYL